MRRKGQGVHTHRHRHHHGKGIFGGILNGAAGLSNLIGGNGSSEASKVLSGIGGVANVIGLGVEHKHNPIKKARKTKARHGKGFLGNIGQLAKSGAKSLAQKGISAGADYINNQIQGLGVKHRRIVGRRSLAHKKEISFRWRAFSRRLFRWRTFRCLSNFFCLII